MKKLCRFKSLINLGEETLLTKIHYPSQSGRGFVTPSYDRVDSDKANQWGISSLHLIEKIFGEESTHFVKFNEFFTGFDSIVGFDNAKSALAIFRAAKDDYENGYLFNTKVLIEAEVFDDFLEQAEHLLKQGYFAPAAVIASCVLEDGLRKLGQRKIPSFPTDKTIDPMNIELAKNGIYSALWQKKITALADLRNKAAHGKWTEFTKKDVEDMIRDVRRFMEDYLG